MVDFSSALYLGLTHGSAELESWARLTTGAPAALVAPPGAHAVARSLAELQGCESGILAPSTLHLFWDLFAILAEEPVTICMDAGTYPIGRWGIERVRGRDVPVRAFAHHDPDALGRVLQRGPRNRWPIVVADGFCPACGSPAPLAEYLGLTRRYGGLIILDDTQALGVMGESPVREAPYGTGGGGSLRHSRISGADVLVASSLAKGFGVPVAALSGAARIVRRFAERSLTRVHCSPPSAAVIRAAEHALGINRRRGDALRLRLARLVGRFRHRLAAIGCFASGGLFPVQTLQTERTDATIGLHEHLLAQGIRTVLQRSSRGRAAARIAILISARHTPGDIDRAIAALSRAPAAGMQTRLPCQT